MESTYKQAIAAAALALLTIAIIGSLCVLSARTESPDEVIQEHPETQGPSTAATSI